MVSSSINEMGHGVAFANESHWKITKTMISSGVEVVAMGESSRRRKEARQRHLDKDSQQQKQRQKQKRQEEQRERNITPAPVRRLGLYERAMQERELKEAKLQSIRKELMEEYTFTPKIPSSSTSSRTATTNASSSGGQSDSVFDRLYRHAGSVATPTPVQVRKQYPRDQTQLRPTRAGGNSPSSTTASGITKTSATSRIDELYHSGVRRARSRPNSNREEKEVRERRREAKELRECTFRPQINWGKPDDTASKLSMAAKLYSHGRIGISPREHSKSKTIMAPVLKQRRTPPREIVVAGLFIQMSVMDTPRKARVSANGTPWQSPVRRRHHQELPIISDYAMVSPLRDPSVVEDSSSHVHHHHHSNLPRIPIYLTVETADDTGDTATRTDDTEYGSI